MPKRADANQASIIEVLRQCGATVADLHALGHGIPDLCVGWQGQNILIEVKAGRGTLTPDEARFHAEWRGQVCVIRDVDDALKLLDTVSA